MDVQLATPVPPGGAVTLHMAFTTQLPRVFARSGYADDFHMVAQWFPKPGVLHPDGRWDAHPFTFHSEFFADFGGLRRRAGSAIDDGGRGDRGRAEPRDRGRPDAGHLRRPHGPRFCVGGGRVAARADARGRWDRNPPADPRGPGGRWRRALRHGRGHAALDAGSLRRLPLVDDDDRPPAAQRRRRGGHGVPDPVHQRRPSPDARMADRVGLRRALLGAVRDRARAGAPVVSGAFGLQRVCPAVAGRGAQLVREPDGLLRPLRRRLHRGRGRVGRQGGRAPGEHGRRPAIAAALAGGQRRHQRPKRRRVLAAAGRVRSGDLSPHCSVDDHPARADRSGSPSTRR